MLNIKTSFMEQKREWSWSFPSKTFLVGEYGALVEGGCLLLNTDPRFVQLKNGQFLDPHQQRGGFGASSAKWLCKYLSCNHLTKNENERLLDVKRDELDVKLAIKLREAYQKEIKQSEPTLKIIPSGVDILSQCIGHVAYIDVKKNIFKPLSWPFNDLNFLIFPTGNKAFTLEHLKKDIKIQDCKLLSEKSQNVIDAFLKHRKSQFLSTLNNFDSCLENLGFCCEQTLSLKKHIKKYFPQVIVKGCGALGMDTLLLICPSDIFLDVKSFIKKDILSRQDDPLITHQDLTDGIAIGCPLLNN